MAKMIIMRKFFNCDLVLYLCVIIKSSVMCKYLRLLNLIYSVLILTLFPFTSTSQTINDFGFDPWFSPVVSENNKILSNAWAGGLNNIQTGEIDLNRDGLNDLLLFERHGNKLMPFIYTQASNKYVFDPSFRKFFPPIVQTMQLHDYNNDQLPDIFTYTTGGIMVYRNITQETIKFEKAVKQFLRSLQGSTYTNLLVTNVDYPAITDLDLDGDLDILTFWGLGSFVELHQNMSIETYGIPDSLLYHKVDYCWGNFAENAESNQLLLDTCVNIESKRLLNDRHTGSTLSVFDINNDNIDDLLLGDVDFMNIQGLINTGTSMDAYMTQIIDSFPSTSPVKLASFPSIQQIDAYNDGIRDILLSPFDPSLTKSAGQNSLWNYSKNADGTFTKITESFIQESMIDLGLGSYPVLKDINNDQLRDLIIGNYGKLDSVYYDGNGQLKCNYISTVSLYLNNGTETQPSFELVSNDLGELSKLSTVSLIMDFADLNNDGLTDLVVGTGDGRLLIFFNKGLINNIPQYKEYIEINTFSGGAFLAPALADLDGDGLTDIISGNQNGKISYYKNIGTLNTPLFDFITHEYGQINVTDPLKSYTGYSVPKLFNGIGNKLIMTVGSESGTIFYYPNLPENPNDKIDSKSDVFSIIQEGIRTSATIADINKDGYPDMVTGNYGGGINLFKGTIPGPSGITESLNTPSLELYPNPAYSKRISIIFPMEGLWKVEFYNITGELTDRVEVTGSKSELDIKSMRSGLYLIVASREDYIITGKLSVIR